MFEWIKRQLSRSAGGATANAITLRTERALAAGSLRVDREAGTIKGASIITRGPALGHGFQVDDVMLQQVAEQINAKKNGIKVRLNHDFGEMVWADEGIAKLVGRATDAAVEGDRVRATLQFGAYAKSSPRGDLWSYLFDLAEDEAMREQVGLSISYEPDDYEEITDPETGLMLPPAGRVKELLSVDFTDDPGANPTGMLRASYLSAREAEMNPALMKYLESIGLKADANEEEARTFLSGLKGDQKVVADALSAAPQAGDPKPAGNVPPAPAGDGDAPKPHPDGLAAQRAAEAAIQAERTRVRELHGLAETCNLGAGWAQERVLNGTSVADARQQALKQLASDRKPLPIGAIRVGMDRNRDTLDAAITDAILLRAGVRLYEEDPDSRRIVLNAERRPEAREPHERSREFRALSLVEIGRAWLQAIGIPDAQSLSRTRVAELVLSRNRLRQRYGVVALAQGTSDFSYLLEDAMGKSLRAAYVEAPSTWSAWARRATAPDFKQIKRVSLGEAGDLVARAEGGEITYVTLAEGREVYALVEYAGGIKLTRQALINDDLDAFSRVPQLQANSARRKEDDVCYAVLTANATMADGTALFASGHANLGTAGVPSSTTIGEARHLMRIQTGPGGAILNLVPVFLIAPSYLETTVINLLAPEYVLTASGTSQQNQWAGKIAPVIEPRLDATVDADTDKNSWYMAAANNQCDTIEVAFLEDEQEPQLKQETEFDTGDRKYAVTHVVAAKAIDHRGLFKNVGD